MNQKIIKIFLASSINEFQAERNELGRFILGINNMNIKLGRNIYCYLELCENSNKAMSETGRKQNEYNAFIENADAVFVLFCSKAGTYTVEELRLAQQCFVQKGSPKVYTYFKDFDEQNLTPEVKSVYDIITSEYKHFFATFTSIESVEVDILRAMLEIAGDDSMRVTIADEKVYLGEQEIMAAAELDYIRNNKEIDKLKRKIVGLQSGDARYTDGLFGEEIDEEIAKCEKRLAERYQKCFAALESRYRSIASGDEISYTLQAIYNAATQGDFSKVMEILDTQSIRNHAKQLEQEQRVSRKRFLMDDLEQLKQGINAATQKGDYDACEAYYAQAVEHIDGLSLYKEDAACLNVWYDYVVYLRRQNHSAEAIAQGERLCLYYELVAADEDDKAALYNLLGVLYDDQNQPQKAITYYLKAIAIREKLYAENPERYAGNLATSYNNAGNLYSDQGQPKQAEAYYLKAIAIYEKLYEENPERYAGDLADIYNNAGIFYKDQGQPKQAEAYYLKAIAIREKLYAENPERYAGNLATSYNNAGVFYDDQGQPKQAEAYYLKAVAIREKLYEENPERYAGDLAVSYYNFAVFKGNRAYFQLAFEKAKASLHDPYSRQIYEALKADFE